MKNSKSALALVGLVAAMAVALPAAAQMGRDSGFYIGGSIGGSKAKDFCSSLGGGATSCDEKDTAWRLLAGYQINRNFAIEAGYHDLGKFSTTGPAADVDANAWELVGIGAIPVGALSFYGKLGVFRGEAKGGGAAAGTKETNGAVTFGLGLQYDITRQFGLRGEWQRYPKLGGGNFGGDTDVDVFSLGALFRFQ